MSKEKFLKSLESISEQFVCEEKVNDLIEEVNSVFEEFEDKIEEIESDVKEKDEKIDNLKDEVGELEGVIEEIESLPKFNIDNEMHNNIRTVSCLESIFNNLDYIPIEELETIVKKYAVL